MAKTFRNLRIGSLIQRSLHSIFIKLDLHHITVSEVVVTSDLGLAKIYFVITDQNQHNAQDIVNELESHSFLIKKQLAMNIKLRKMPNLKFIFDKSFDEFDKINNLLKIEPIKNYVD